MSILRTGHANPGVQSDHPDFYAALFSAPRARNKHPLPTNWPAVAQGQRKYCRGFEEKLWTGKSIQISQGENEQAQHAGHQNAK